MIEKDGRKWYGPDDLECYMVGFESYRLMKKLKADVYDYILDHADYLDAIFMSTRAAERARLHNNDLIITVPVFVSPHMEPDHEIMIVKTTTEAPPEARVEIATWPGVDEVNPEHHLINSISITA
jgi:hypothetical protein